VGVSPANLPGGPGEPPGGPRDEWERRQRAAVRRANRGSGPPSGRNEDSDPYGWSSANGEGAPPTEYPQPGPPRREEPRTQQWQPGGWQAGQLRDEPQRDEWPGGEPLRDGGPARGERRRDEGERRRDGAAREESGGLGRRLRGPHRRRAEGGQLTGLDPDKQSDLPTWLQERSAVQVAPVRRRLSLSVALFASLLTVGLVLGAYTMPKSYAFVIFGVQLLFVLSWTVAMRPAGARVVAAVGLAAAVGADLSAAWLTHPSLAPLALVTVAAFVVGVVGQLLRGSGRTKPTESLGATLIVVVGVVCFGMLVVLSRHAKGTESIVACLGAAGVAIVVARLTDIVFPTPRTSPQVPRGSVGVVLGAMAGTVAAGVIGSVLVGLTPQRAVLVGLFTASCGVLADLAVSYAEASRDLAGEESSLWIARHMQGPLGGFALAAPVAYVLSLMVLVTSLN
jgi:hypothetical protein